MFFLNVNIYINSGDYGPSVIPLNQSLLPIKPILYENLGQQPNLIENPIGTSINHLFFFTYLSALGLISRLRNKKIINSFQFLFCISIFLELSHWLIPNRAFEYYDLFANSLGVVIAHLFVNLFFKK